MFYVVGFLLCIITVYDYIKERNVFSPLFIFGGVWTLITFLSAFHMYEMISTSAYIYVLVLTGVVSFFCGVYVRDRVRLSMNRIRGLNAGVYNEINYYFMFLFYTPILLFTIRLALSSLRQLQKGVPMETIRFAYSDPDSGLVMTNDLEYIIENYIVQAAVFASVALIPIVVGYGKSIKKYILLGELLAFQVAYIFASGARSFLIDVAFLFILYVFINARLRKKIKDYFIKIPLPLIALIVAGAVFTVVLMTLLRKGENSLGREIYRYFTICYPLFERHIELKKSGDMPYTLGWGLLHGLLKPEFVIIRKFFGIQFPEPLREAAYQINYNNDFFFVGGGKANSFVSVFYYMFMDFGVPGIIVGCFSYGYLAQAAYKKMLNNTDIRSQAIYLLVAIGLFLSFVRFHFTAHRYVYAFLIICLCFKRSADSSPAELQDSAAQTG